MEAILSSPINRVQAFLAAGHAETLRQQQKRAEAPEQLPVGNDPAPAARPTGQDLVGHDLVDLGGGGEVVAGHRCLPDRLDHRRVRVERFLHLARVHVEAAA